MQLNSLKVQNFKNFKGQYLEFQNKINCFIGANGIGKTNLLDAMYHLAFGKSYFHSSSKDCIKFGSDYFFIEGQFNIGESEEKIICSYKHDSKKVLSRNDKVTKKLSDHIGLIPTVMVSPYDRNLIDGPSRERRKFIDGVISQINSEFLQNLISYNKVLTNRNAYLKLISITKQFDKQILETYNQQLVLTGNYLHAHRKSFVDQFTPILIRRYDHISSKSESIRLTFQSQLRDANLGELLSNSLETDVRLGYTTKGVHRDDLGISLKDQPIRKFGSQGQQKSVLTALKLAQFDFLKSKTNTSPLLLLDDAFDKLDQSRVSQIINLVDDEDFSQIFLTDTHLDRTHQVLSNLKTDYQIFELKGLITK